MKNRRAWYSRIRLGIALLILAAMGSGIISGTGMGLALAAFQAGPMWIRLSTGAALFSVLAIATLMVMTLIFGRFYCAILCPLGTVQDMVDTAVPRRNGTIPNARWLRYPTALISMAFLAGGWVIAFQVLDPFTRFVASTQFINTSLRHGTIFTTVVFLGGVLPIAVLIALVMWKRRIFCTTVCPVGAVLGMISRFSLFRMRMTASCHGCGVCTKACPAGCINVAARSVDAERCLLCLRCVSACGHHGISYQPVRFAVPMPEPSPNPSRRGFLVQGAAFIALGGSAYGIARALQSPAFSVEAGEPPLLPPGATDSRRFARLCTGCLVCASACPAAIIKPSRYGFGPVRVEYGPSACQYGCTQCNSVCPSGALTGMTLQDKQWYKIGEAIVDVRRCVGCGNCARACPKDAVRMVDGGFDRVAEIAGFHCIGCGMCFVACPSSAITVRGIEQRPMGL